MRITGNHNLKEDSNDDSELHILVIEDDEECINYISRGFETWQRKHRIVIAGSLDAARHILLDYPPDIAFIDLTHPEGEIIDHLFEDPFPDPFPVIILINHSEEHRARPLLNNGALDYLIKSEYIVQDISHVCERSLREWRQIKARIAAEHQLIKKTDEIVSRDEEMQAQLDDLQSANKKILESEERFRQLFIENIAGYALHEIICDISGVPINYRFWK